MPKRIKKESASSAKLLRVLLVNALVYAYYRIFKSQQGSRRYASRIRIILTQLGPTYMKFGQTLSTRYDIFPADIIEELSKLQDDIKPIPFSLMKEEIESRLGRLDKIFMEIEEAPLASASIAQVYRGRLLDGSIVAIKVRRPNITKTVKSDVRQLLRIARVVDHLPYLGGNDLKSVIKEFGESIEMEMDFIAEAKAMEDFRKFFRKSPIIYAPTIYPKLCRSNIIVMEYIEGLHISHLVTGDYDREEYPINNRKFLEAILEAVLDQIFVYGRLNSDPHPGNFIITRNGRIYFIDFGRMTTIDEDLRAFLMEYIVSIARKDPEFLTEIINERFGVKDKETYIKSMAYMFSRYYGKRLNQLNLGEMMVSSFKISKQNRVDLPAQIFLLSRVLLMLEGMGFKLDPDIDYMGFIKDYFGKRRAKVILLQRLHRGGNDAVWNVMMLERRLRGFDRLLNGNTKFHIKLPAIEKQLSNFVRALNALAVSVIMAALIITLQKSKYPIIPAFIFFLALYIIYELIFKEEKIT